MDIWPPTFEFHDHYAVGCACEVLGVSGPVPRYQLLPVLNLIHAALIDGYSMLSEASLDREYKEYVALALAVTHSVIVASACREGGAAETETIWSCSVAHDASHHACGERGASANRGVHRASSSCVLRGTWRNGSGVKVSNCICSRCDCRYARASSRSLP